MQLLTGLRFDSRLCLRLASCALLLLGVQASHAQSQDVFTLRAALSVVSDDNFLRSPAATAVSEQTTTETVGVNVALPYGLQHFALDASLNSNQHQNLSNFDFVAQNYNAAWQWSFTPEWHGSLSSTRAETLNAAADSANPTLRNKNTTQATALSAAYELGGPWQLTAGLTDNTVTNERALTNAQTDNHSSGVSAGVRYALGSGNSVAYALQTATGSSGNDYRSTTHDLTAVWVPSGNTSVNAHLAFLDQRFALVPQFDFSGVAGGVSLTWRLSGKTSVAAGWQRDLASFQSAGSTYTQTDSVTIGPLWQVSPKTALRLQYRYAVLDNQGNPTGVPIARQDRSQDTSLTYSWQIRSFASLSVMLGDFNRSSTVPNSDYTARQFSLAGQFSF